MRGPEEEKLAAASLFNRYCIRCHGVDGRGVWDIPGVPNFASLRFHASRSDDQLARAIMQGRGAVMPTFRGALSLEEAWALARHLRSFVPGTEVSRGDDDEPRRKANQRTDQNGAKADASNGEASSTAPENLPAPDEED